MTKEEIEERFTPMMAELFKANKTNLIALGAKSLQDFPLSTMMLKLDEMAGHPLAKLMADVQKRAFLLGALAAYASQENKWRTVQ